MSESPIFNNPGEQAPKRVSVFDDLTWRTLPPTTVERSKLCFGGNSDCKLDPILFPKVVSLREFGYRPLENEASREDKLKEVALYAGKSLAKAFTSFEGAGPQALEETLRAHLGGIIEAFSEIDPKAVGSVVHSFYVIERDLRFLEQARSIPGGREAFEARHNLICDEMGVDIVRDGLFEELVESKLFALRGFLDVCEGLIKRAHRAASLSQSLEEIKGALDDASPGLGEKVNSVVQHPFAVVVNCRVGRERSLIEELNFGERKAGQLPKVPVIIVIDEDWLGGEDPKQVLKGALADSVEGFFTRPCFKEAKGSFGFESERKFLMYMLFGDQA